MIQYFTSTRKRAWGGAVGAARRLSREARISLTPSGAILPEPTHASVPTILRTMYRRNPSASISIVRYPSLSASQAGPDYVSHGMRARAPRAFESLEIMRPRDMSEGLLHGGKIETGRNEPGVLAAHGGRNRTVQDPVSVYLRSYVVTGMKIFRDFTAGADHDFPLIIAVIPLRNASGEIRVSQWKFAACPRA
jgi:hypothetical protein